MVCNWDLSGFRQFEFKFQFRTLCTWVTLVCVFCSPATAEDVHVIFAIPQTELTLKTEQEQELRLPVFPDDVKAIVLKLYLASVIS